MTAFFVLITFDMVFPDGTSDDKKTIVRNAFHKELLQNQFKKAKASTAFFWAASRFDEEVDIGHTKALVYKILKKAKTVVVAKQQLSFDLVIDVIVSYAPPVEMIV